MVKMGVQKKKKFSSLKYSETSAEEANGEGEEAKRGWLHRE